MAAIPSAPTPSAANAHIAFAAVVFPPVPAVLWLHCKKSWRKTPPAWPDDAVTNIRGMEHFFDMQIELIQRFPTIKTKYFDAQGCSAEFFNRFPMSCNTVFWQFSVTFPTDESKSKVASPGLDPATFRVSTHYSTTAPELLCCNVLSFVSTLFTFVNTVFSFVSTVLSFVSNVLTFVSTVFPFVSTLFTFVSTVFFSLSVLCSSLLCFSSSVLCSPSSILCFSSSVMC